MILGSQISKGMFGGVFQQVLMKALVTYPIGVGEEGLKSRLKTRLKGKEVVWSQSMAHHGAALPLHAPLPKTPTAPLLPGFSPKRRMALAWGRAPRTSWSLIIHEGGGHYVS